MRATVMYGAGDVRIEDVPDAPFLWSDGTCVVCREGLHTSCLHGGRLDEVPEGYRLMNERESIKFQIEF